MKSVLIHTPIMLSQLSIFVSLYLLLLTSSPVIASVLPDQVVHQSLKSNPLSDYYFFVEPSYIHNINRTIEVAPTAAKKALENIIDVPTAFWLSNKTTVDSSENIRTIGDVLKDVSEKQQKDNKVLATFVVYNLPNRDCAASASAGEICCSYNKNGTCNYLDKSNRCEEGINDYKFEYIDKIAEKVSEYCETVPMALIIEPDSLPNLITNLDNEKCSNNATQAAYRTGIKYAVDRLKNACPKAIIYVDAAHGGWLGWEDNTEGFLNEIKSLGISHLIRGFAINVSNYQELGMMCPEVGMCLPSSDKNDHECCKQDACGLSSEFNPGFTTLNYVASFNNKSQEIISDFDFHYVIDTGRSGVPDARDSCSSWCNVRNAGFGVMPTTDTADKSLVDAYLWIKPPGESDGCTELLPDGSKCPRFDEKCASEDSLGSKDDESRAPEAGGWFLDQIILFASNTPKRGM